MFPVVDTKDPAALEAHACSLLGRLFPGHPDTLLRRLFKDVLDMFQGRYLDYQALDLRYHDLEHTLQACLCLLEIFQGRSNAGAEPRLQARELELAVAAALLHDTGYLRLRSDRSGTSAKYTHAHVLRSGAFAASYLPTIGFTAEECDVVTAAIHCTGRYPWSTKLHFHNLRARLIACMLVTADYLGQMAAPDYPEELDALYQEFRESDDYYHIPESQRSFISSVDLAESTPCFWHHSILRKLEQELDGMHRFLAIPYPEGPNPYLKAIETNIARIGLHPSEK
jgi:predicted metal-dependent HD superfamily phosphohydrolase